MIRRAVVVLAALAFTGSGVGAQVTRGGDAALRAGTVGPAEAALYAAVRTHPRDPASRVALGRYLMARGAARVGMTLLEEAIRFGGDATAIEPDLARAYLATGEYRSLAGLKSISLDMRARAQWLAAHESRTVAPDSIVRVSFQVTADSAAVGRVTLRVNGRLLEAAITARVSGIVIADTAAVAGDIHRFATEGERGAVLAVADSVGLGGVSISNVPVTVARVDGMRTALIGLDLLGQYAAAFDAAAAQITLHVGMPRVVLPNGTRFVTWSTPSNLQLLQAAGWISITRPSIGRLLREHRWTFDAARGVLVVER
jgi:hypothetical protein